jgi:hypothetical protein
VFVYDTKHRNQYYIIPQTVVFLKYLKKNPRPLFSKTEKARKTTRTPQSIPIGRRSVISVWPWTYHFKASTIPSSHSWCLFFSFTMGVAHVAGIGRVAGMDYWYPGRAWGENFSSPTERHPSQTTVTTMGLWQTTVTTMGLWQQPPILGLYSSCSRLL